MIKSIRIYNRFNMDVFVSTEGLNFPYNHWYLISIYGESNKPLMDVHAQSVFKKLGLQQYISLNFWDVDDKHFRGVKLDYPEAILFNKDHANQIISFLDAAKLDIADSVLVIHCQAGISRSGAVGTFACDYCDLDYNKFMKDNPDIFSNQYVLNLLRREAHIIPFVDKRRDGIDWVNIDKDYGIERFKRLVLKQKD